MDIIRIHHPYDQEKIINEDIVLVLGFFDGVHRGHQAVIDRGVEIAKNRGLKCAVMTFNRHPAFVYRSFDPDKHTYLTPIDRKEDIIRNLGVDILYEVDFTASFGRLSPQEFVDQYIVDWHAKIVVAGFDYTYGTAAQANMNTLHKYAKNRFEIVTVDKKVDEKDKISSTRIRRYISEGKIDQANDLLGYIYEISGFVIHGDARGRDLGYPTANIYPHPYVMVPKRGVYAVKLWVNNVWLEGMASIGYNPTFGYRPSYSIEVHIFNFSEDIYGEDVKVKWVDYLRDEIKFNSVEELIERLDQDELDAKESLAKVKINQI
ncbi:bifunctional riboflavin kinase/FAD synthetase [Alkalibacterium sp. 20]|uniref:bifunctional riboflavin kinase/FAD synthetase n=1 Tax=Alkalibacterium sp. 20 TaxID=1798803 RepID=UPI0009000168|nr:bifunctional riboflavin kinase/FAD synthetase [Alkalibacterium sp. 20]OJF95222.1 bifunctional riboflavin kinase/FMN adenylyltransferase [Alkalibacterium sp. 20]